MGGETISPGGAETVEQVPEKGSCVWKKGKVQISIMQTHLT